MKASKAGLNRVLVWLAIVAMSWGAAWAQQESEIVLTSETDYARVISQVSTEDISATINQLASLDSRIPGYPGAERAAQIVEERFRQLGLDDVTVEEFPVVVPVVRPDEQGRAARLEVERGGSAELAAVRVWEILPLWPNLVRCPKTPPGGISGQLIYAGSGELRAFNGLDVSDSVVLLDFNSGSNWFNAPLLGARAVLFIEPDETIRGEAEEKFLSMPVDIPRFWVPRACADYLRGLLKSKETIRVRLHCDIEWQKVTGKNITGRIKGTDPRLSKQQVVIQAYYDSIAITPTQAPGAENACSIAALFQIIKAFVAQPPPRTIVFLATSGHFEGLAGTKAYVRRRIRGARSDAHIEKMFTLVETARGDIEKITDRLWTTTVGGPYGTQQERPLREQIRGLGGLLKKVNSAAHKARKLHGVIQAATRRTDPNRGKIPEYQLSEEELAERQRLVDKFDERLPQIQQASSEAVAVIGQARQLREQGNDQQKQSALAKVQEAIEALTAALDFSEEDIYLWFSVDLSSHNQAFGIFFKGYYYNYSEGDQWRFSEIGKKAREYSALIANALLVERDQRFIDGINAIKGKAWHTYMAGRLALSSEVATLAGIPGLGFATIDDSRPYVDTLMDLPVRVQIDNLGEQTRFLACLLLDLVAVREPKDIYELELADNFVEVKGRLVEFDPLVSTFPDKAVPRAIALARPTQKTAMGVRAQALDLTDEQGRFALIGLPNVRAVGGNTTVEGYLLARDDGSIQMAPDQGVNGAKQYPIELGLTQRIKPTTIVLFACKSMAIYDMIDQRFFELLSQIYVYDATTDAAPPEYGYALPLPPRELTSTYEPVAVVFARSGSRVKVTMAATLLGLRFVLINSTREEPEGNGYLIDDHPSLYATPYRVAADMWLLDDHRIRRLFKHGIENDRVKDAHQRAEKQLQEADLHWRQREYDKFFTAARAAWSNESRAYPDVRKTEDDVIKGIIFYLALLMPFSFFTERLLIGAPDIKWQITGVLGIFLAIFIVIGLVHPAFAISFTPVIILLAFIILALTVVVISIIVQKFEEQMKAIRYTQTGVHSADVGRLGASAAAFSLGISNMRRRKVRTFLTCTTLILLTFTVLSFTSVVQTVRANKILLPKLSPYNGIMMRDRSWLPIGEPTTHIINNEFGSDYPVAPRAWYFSGNPGEQSFVTIRRGDALPYAATAMAGFSPKETQITHIDKYLVPGGRWFGPNDKLVCILPAGIASALGVAPEQVGTATIRVFGTEMRVIGILRSTRFTNAADLDGEPLTPVDFLLMAQQMAQQREQQRQGRAGKGEELREYIHLASDNILIVPYDFVINVGGSLRSVAIGIPEAEEVSEILDRLIQRIELNIYAGRDGKTYLCSAVGTTSFTGVTDLIIPILIAAAIVLNTMLGSVYERVREIYIYSSLGLAPTHVAALFIAEASVYAVMGAVAGYLVGQVAAKIITQTHIVEGLNLNYSSLSAVATTLLIMATVLASVMYPARRASDIAMPGIERRWSLPDPEEDQLAMDLPFTVTGDQALGVNMYLHEYLIAHTDYSLGQFSTGDIDLSTARGDYGDGYALSSMVWLAPYDLGVSEQLVIETLPTRDEEIYQIHCRIIRRSGDDASWMRVTRNFVNILRKQYLLWRTFPVAQKGEYGERGRKLLAGELEETVEQT